MSDSGDKIYTGFAYYYDDFMDDIPYDDWAEKIIGILKSEGINDGIVCELGCGTGEMTGRLSDAGYDMIGIDISEDMLALARDKMYESGREGILYLLQDMRNLELFGTVKAFVSVCDSMNYIVSDEDMLDILRKVNNYLDPGGLFIFDLKSDYFYRTEYGDNEFTEEDEDGNIFLSWKNHYDKERKINQYHIEIDEPDEDGEMIKTVEEHVQRAYWPDEIHALIDKAGMEFVGIKDSDTMKAPGDECKRYYIIAREKTQKNKLYI
ncbi:MAG: class I SAM-dependent methyltransferase [Lachnospiraceae bacterium]|nr:class I SAM-dependent methyltransferase [Lachnospiraceae bacterium]